MHLAMMKPADRVKGRGLFYRVTRSYLMHTNGAGDILHFQAGKKLLMNT